jgi:hypothetical protein
MLKIKGEVYNVVNAEKIGKVVVHVLDRPLTEDNSSLVG